MKYIEDKLDKLDKTFATKKESEKWMVIFFIAGAIAYLLYMYFLPYTKRLYKESERKKTSIEKSIRDNSVYLTSISRNGDQDFKVKMLDHEIENKNKQRSSLDNKIVFINQNLDKLSDMLFNKKSWSKFLNSITDRAKLHDVDIQYIKNQYVGKKGKFGHVLEISVGCQGEYKGIVKLMNELEQNTLVTDIYSTHLKVDENTSKIMADINISVWGVNH